MKSKKKSFQIVNVNDVLSYIENIEKPIIAYRLEKKLGLQDENARLQQFPGNELAMIRKSKGINETFETIYNIYNESSKDDQMRINKVMRDKIVEVNNIVTMSLDPDYSFKARRDLCGCYYFKELGWIQVKKCSSMDKTCYVYKLDENFEPYGCMGWVNPETDEMLGLGLIAWTNRPYNKEINYEK